MKVNRSNSVWFIEQLMRDVEELKAKIQALETNKRSPNVRKTRKQPQKDSMDQHIS